MSANAVVRFASIQHASLVTAIATALAAGAIGFEVADAPSGPAARVPAGNPIAEALGGANNAKAAERLREGTKLVDVVGTFQSAGGDNISFSREGGKDSLKVLENLQLQRVSTVLEENSGTRQWIVSGEITEFRGANYLLVKKAVVQLQDGDAAGR
jgi:hypothetical protein